jgi:hypothetical protein
MFSFLIKDSLRQDLISVLTKKQKVNDTIALIISMLSLLIGVFAVS